MQKKDIRLLLAGVAATAIAGFATYQHFNGESIWLEGVALIGLYIIIATAFWWG